MKNYSVYLRLSNPACCVKVASFSFRPTASLLDSIVRDYVDWCVCTVVSAELRLGRQLVLYVDYCY